MRGVVMIIMALDHTREYFHADALLYDPTDLTKTYPVLFFTRWITHFCAPTFVLLAGVAARLSLQRKSKNELSLFLITRGVWLVLLEVTVIRFSFFFNLYYDALIFQVIWAIGISMIVLAAVIRLPMYLIVILGAAITLGHDALNMAIRLQPGEPLYVLWAFVQQSGFFPATPNHFIMVPYPVLPWLGIMILGYAMGEWFTPAYDSRRSKLLFRTSMLAIAGFVILRLTNLYGDPAPWSQQKDVVFTLLSFLNCTKYPASLLYILMTLGPVLLLLSWMEKRPDKIKKWKAVEVFGRVPLFYYILHFYLIHLGSILLYMITTGKSFSELDFHFNAGFGGLPPGAGYILAWTYVVWIAVVLITYPVCKWYNQYKSTHKQWWLSYL